MDKTALKTILRRRYYVGLYFKKPVFVKRIIGSPRFRRAVDRASRRHSLRLCDGTLSLERLLSIGDRLQSARTFSDRFFPAGIEFFEKDELCSHVHFVFGEPCTETKQKTSLRNLAGALSLCCGSFADYRCLYGLRTRIDLQYPHETLFACYHFGEYDCRLTHHVVVTYLILSVGRTVLRSSVLIREQCQAPSIQGGAISHRGVFFRVLLLPAV